MKESDRSDKTDVELYATFKTVKANALVMTVDGFALLACKVHRGKTINSVGNSSPVP